MCLSTNLFFFALKSYSDQLFLPRSLWTHVFDLSEYQQFFLLRLFATRNNIVEHSMSNFIVYRIGSFGVLVIVLVPAAAADGFNLFSHIAYKSSSTIQRLNVRVSVCVCASVQLLLCFLRFK